MTGSQSLGEDMEAGSLGQNRKGRGEGKSQRWREKEMKMELAHVLWRSHK